MKHVAVLFAPLDVSRDFIDYPYFADLGAAQVAAYLRQAGHPVSLVDALAMPGSTLTPLADDRVQLGAPLDLFLSRVPLDADAYVVALTPFHRPPTRDVLLAATLSHVRRARPAVPIVLADLYQSGQHVVDAASEAVLAAYPEVSAILRYEAERDLGGLLAELASRDATAPALSRRGGDLASIDDVPLPAWDLVDLDAYFAFHAAVIAQLGRPSWAFPIDGPSMPLVTSRGCPYRCIHCSSNPGTREAGVQIAPKTQRRHGLAHLDRALGDLRARGARRIHVLDELVNVNEAHFDGFLALLVKHDLSFEVPNGMRADYVLPRHLEAMKGRLTTLSISAESGVPRVVAEVVKKQLDLGEVERVAREAGELSVPMLIHFMIGLPGETRQEINGTLAFAAGLHEATGAFCSVQFATPLPGTVLARQAEEKGRRVLPLIRDFGPHFQREPSLETEAATLAELSAFRRAYDERLRALDEPRPVLLDVTHRCNNRCSFCVSGTGPQIEGDLSVKLGLLRAHRARGSRRVALGGGEPTLSPHLFRLISEARQLGYDHIGLTTNGRMASYLPFAERLVASGLHEVDVSLHGASAVTHGELVGDPDAFEQTCLGLKQLAQAASRGVRVGAAVTLTRANLDELVAVGELAASLGAKALLVQGLTPFGPGTGALAVDDRRAGDAVVALADAMGDRLLVRVANLPRCLLSTRAELAIGDVPWIHANDLPGLDAHVRAHRVKQPVCEGCPHALCCAGFYVPGERALPLWDGRAAQ